METFKIADINKNVKLIVPVNADIPISQVVDNFNIQNSDTINKVIVDMLVYVGDSKNRFQYCDTENGEINLKKFASYIPNDFIVEKSYELFSSAPVGVIMQIFSSTIRKKILKKKSSELQFHV